MTEFGKVTQVGEKHISRVSHVPTASGRDPSISEIFGTPYLRPKGRQSMYRQVNNFKAT